MEAYNRIDRRRLEQAAPVAAVEWHAELASTNDRALALAAESQTPHALPLVIVAERQAAGRGRGGNTWWAAEGALTFSLLLDTSALELPPARWPLASLTTGLAVCETLDQLAPQAWAALKWPNDVYLRERKACGILIEAPPAIADRLVVGIGINVNNGFADAPPEVRQRAISLKDATGLPFDMTEVLLRVLGQLALRWKQLAAGDIEFAALWQRWCLLTGRHVTVASGNTPVRGLCRGIDAEGALLVTTEQGEQRLFAGTVVGWE